MPLNKGLRQLHFLLLVSLVSLLVHRYLSLRLTSRGQPNFTSSFAHKKKMSSFDNSNPLNFSWQQTMLRIKDPNISVPFYERHFGFKLLHKYDK